MQAATEEQVREQQNHEMARLLGQLLSVQPIASTTSAISGTDRLAGRLPMAGAATVGAACRSVSHVDDVRLGVT
jgi:hypothetical protein